MTRPVIGRAGGAPGSAPGIPLTFLFILPLRVLLLKLGLDCLFGKVVQRSRIPNAARVGILRRRL